MKKLLLLILTFSCAISSLSQQKSVDKKAQRSEILIKKLIITNDLENQVKDVPFAAVRVLARCRIASWLWKDGKDDTGRAEQIAVKAVDDLYENKAEIPDVYFNGLRPELFALLDRNAKDEANRLREKHNISSDDGSIISLLDQKNGERLATDAAIKSLADQSQTNLELVFLIRQLQSRNSPEFLRLLTAIVHAEETGRTRFTANMLFSMCSYFIEPSTPTQLQKRFLKIVVNKSRNAAQMPNGDTEGFFNLLSWVLPTISNNFPDLLSEVGAAHAILRTRASQETRESQERNDRIKNSADKLSALIAEAEQTDNKADKYQLYISAAHLALKLKKFIYSVDILGKTVEIDMSSNPIPETVRSEERDRFRGEVVSKALNSGDPDSAKYATKRILDSLAKAESLRKVANYYFDKNNPESAREALDEAIKFAAKAEITPLSVSTLIKLLTTLQRIDPSRIIELSELTAKSINKIPSLNVEDKPHTENYKNYVTSVMIINWNLLPALTKLARENKSGADDLASRINKKEIKIIADYVLLTDSIAQGTDEKKVKN